jgi:hypothetical protein
MRWHLHHRGGWLRIAGYGVRWKDTTTHPLLWSERNGRHYQIKIGRWLVRLLPRAGAA